MGSVPVLSMSRSADGVSGVVVVPMLLAGLGSAVDEPMVALLVRLPVADGSMLAVTSTRTVAPAATGPKLHVRGLRLLQSPWVVAKLTNCSPAGGVSESKADAARDGPLLVTTSE